MNKLLPFVVLLATFKTYSILHNNYEIIGAYSICVSPAQLIVPPLIVLIAFTVLHVSVLLPVSSYFMVKYQKLESENLGVTHNLVHAEKNGLWLKQKIECNHNAYSPCGNDKTDIDSNHGNELAGIIPTPCDTQMIIHASRINHSASTLINTQIFVFNKHGAFVGKIYAPITDIAHKTWFIQEAQVQSLHNTKAVVYHNISLSFSTSIDDLSNQLSQPETVNIWKLQNFIKIAQNLGLSTSQYHIYLWRIIFQPIFMLVMLIFGITFMQLTHIKRNIGYTLAKLLICSLSIYFSNELLIMLLLYKTKNPALSIGLSHILFFTTVIYASTHYRTNIL